ncbi:MAG TPA: 23S rRNA (guanosine(2251)-2'-O)-methyltransferase RlmB, partial [Firmicutes bacterium]|nr:23S rRNA (guanosine(2251)-2'-O)-methyltransferase RlmB [Bacillota bacterium]
MSGEVLVSGRQAVLAALEAGRPMRRIVLARGARGASIELIVQRAREQGVPVQRVDGTVLEALVAEVGSSVRHQGVMALAATRPYRALEELLAMARQRGQPPLLVVLARVEDPGNLGAVARSADFLGAH